jgi:hypothetical protein
VGTYLEYRNARPVQLDEMTDAEVDAGREACRAKDECDVATVVDVSDLWYTTAAKQTHSKKGVLASGLLCMRILET